MAELIYGMGVGFDCLANTKVDDSPSKVSYRFRAPYTSRLETVRFYYLGTTSGSGYGAGTGGTMRVSTQADDGSASHYPSGTILTSTDLPAQTAHEPGRLVAFSSPPMLQAGALYHVVFENTDASPATNNFSVDCGYVVNVPSPLNPRWPDTDWAHLMNEGGSWSVREGMYPILDLSFAAGHYGCGYLEISYGSGEVGEITGTSKMVRELFTVSGGDRVVTSVGIRALRETGTADLTATLEDASGTPLATATLAYDDFVVGDETNYDVSGKGYFVTAALSEPITLTDTETYRLVLSTEAGTTYWAFVIRKGSDYGYDDATVFADGTAEKTSDGTNWSSLGRVSNENDLQFFFTPEATPEPEPDPDPDPDPEPEPGPGAVVRYAAGSATLPFGVMLDEAPAVGNVLLAVCAQMFDEGIGLPDMNVSEGDWTIEAAAGTMVCRVSILSHVVAEGDGATWVFGSDQEGETARVCLVEVSGVSLPPEIAHDGWPYAQPMTFYPESDEAAFILAGVAWAPQDTGAVQTGDLDDEMDTGIIGTEPFDCELWTRSAFIDPTDGAYSFGLTPSIETSAEMVAVVLAGESAPPPPEPGDCPGDPAIFLDVYQVNPPGDSISFLATLCDAFGKQIKVERNNIGSGQFSLSRQSPHATADILAPGNLVKVRIPAIDVNPIFAFFLGGENATLISRDEQGGEIITTGGDGALAYWNNAVWLAESYVVQWWDDAWGVPPAGTIGHVHVAAGTYYTYHVNAAGRITSRETFTTAGFSAWYNGRQKRRWATGSGTPVTLIRISSGAYEGWLIRPWGVDDTPASALLGQRSEFGDIGTHVVQWWDDAWGTPPEGTLGRVQLDPGTYYEYTLDDDERITSRSTFTTGAGFSAWYDHRGSKRWSGGTARVTLVQLSSGAYDNVWIRPWGVLHDWQASAVGEGNAPGQVLKRIFDEGTAAERPSHPIPLMTIDFDELVDSDGNDWNIGQAILGITADLGESYLSTVMKVLETGIIDVEMDPDLGFHAWNSRGRDLTGDAFGVGVVRFVRGQDDPRTGNIASELRRELTDGPVATFTQVIGNDASAQASLPDAADRVARETSTRTDTDDAAALPALGLADLEARLVRSEAIGFAVAVGTDEEAGFYLPGPPDSENGKYWVGDIVTLDTGTGEQDWDNAAERVANITISENEAAALDVVVELGSGLGAIETEGGTTSSTPSFAGGTAAPSDFDGSAYQELADRGAPDGYAGLDGDGLVPIAELPVGTGSAEVAAGDHGHALDDLTDVNAPSPDDGDVITWDAGTSAWIAAAPAGGGVAVEDEGTPLATVADTLNFVGAGVAVTGTGATKTITIPGGGGGGAVLSTLPLPMVNSKQDGGSSASLAWTPTEGNTLILYGGLNGTTGDFTDVALTGVTWTKIHGITGNPSGCLWIGLVGAGAGTNVTWTGNGYYGIAELTGQEWTPALVQAEDHLDNLAHGYVPSSPDSKAVIYVGIAGGGTSGISIGGEGLPTSPIASCAMGPGGLPYYAMSHSGAAISFYAEIT